MKMYIAGPVRRTCPPVPPATPRYLLHPPPRAPLPPGNPCRHEAAGESVRVTWRESKREEKRTGSGSIRRASERDGVIEGDRGNGEAAALLRLEGKGMGAREAEGSQDTHGRERGERTGGARKTRTDKAIAHSQGPALAT